MSAPVITCCSSRTIPIIVKCSSWSAFARGIRWLVLHLNWENQQNYVIVTSCRAYVEFSWVLLHLRIHIINL